MPLTSIEVQQKKFNRAFSGYKDTDVDNFLDLVCDALDRLNGENRELKKRVGEMTEQVSRLRECESSLNRVLLSAQRTADMLIQEAREQADMILRNAQEENVRVREQHAEVLAQYRMEQAEFIQRSAMFKENLRRSLLEQLEWIEEIMPGEETVKPQDA